MMAAISFKVDGIKQLEKQLAKLDEKTAARALKSAILRQARPMVKDAKANAPRDSGALAASIGAYASNDRSKNKRFIGISIGPKKKAKRAITLYLKAHPERYNYDPKKQSGKLIRHGHLVEFGTATGVKAHPFLRPAFDKNVAGFLSGFRAELAASIARLSL